MRQPVEAWVEHGGVRRQPIHDAQVLAGVRVDRVRVVVDVLQAHLVSDHDAATGSPVGPLGGANVDVVISRGEVVDTQGPVKAVVVCNAVPPQVDPDPVLAGGNVDSL